MQEGEDRHKQFKQATDKDGQVIGSLTFKILKGKLKRNTETVGEMDPFIVIQYLKVKYQTAVHKSGGKLPVWNQAFDLPIYSQDHIIKLTCYDKDLILDDTVGETLIRVKALINSEGKRSWVSLYYKKEYAGEILIQTTWKSLQSDVFHDDEDLGEEGLADQKVAEISAKATPIE